MQPGQHPAGRPSQPLSARPMLPFDELAADVKEGTALILELHAKLREVETEVADAFQALEAAAPKQAEA